MAATAMYALRLAPPQQRGLCLSSKAKCARGVAGSSRVRPASRARLSVSAIAVPRAPGNEGTSSSNTLPLPDDLSDVLMSGLNGKALRFPDQMPSKAEVLAAIPEHCFKRDTAKSLLYAAISAALTIGTGVLAAMVIPLQAAYLPAWIAYAIVNGTIATGMWVVAHECGHNAFSNNRTLQDAIGYMYHSFLLVPYFSWQRSHAVHHARTNHLTEGETHCPYPVDGMTANLNFSMKEKLGAPGFLVVQLLTHLVVGWPAYLLWGATGGPSRGVTNHFWPTAPFSEALWPGSWKEKVWKSDIGVVAMLGALVAWGVQAGSALPVLALYVAPLVVTNMWLVGYTWLQHTDTDIPHYEGENWSFVKGAFLTVDRPYGAVLDFLHHRIGSTHVAHHVESSIPHYHALEATNALKKAFPQLYLYDPTPVWKALMRVAVHCVAVQQRGNKWIFVSNRPAVAA